MTFEAMPHKYVSLKTRSPLKLVTLRKNLNLSWLNCSMAHFCVVYSTRAL